MTAVATAKQSRPAPLQRSRRWTIDVLFQDRAATSGLLIVALLVLGALVGPWVVSADPNQIHPNVRFAGPSLEHPLGTDQLGRDVLARLLHGARISIGLTVAATAGTTTLGLLLGLIAATWGGALDGLIMRIVDVLQAMPALLLALTLVGLLGPSAPILVVSIVAVAWDTYARVVRSIALSIKERTYVDAAKAIGAGRWRILRVHVLPNVAGPVLVLSTLNLGSTLLIVSGLSFLGLGLRPPSPEWGAMLAEARNHFTRAPLLLIYPGTTITLFVLAFNLLGDGLRDLLDPRTRHQQLAG